MRKFEKISFKQFQKDVGNIQELYKRYTIPVRSTQNSAGYDFKAIQDVFVPAGGNIKIPTGIKVCMNSNEVLLIIIRSSFGTKKKIRISNQVGVIDMDYYNNIDNEGHIWIAIENNGLEDYTIHQGEAYAQGLILPYLTCDEEQPIHKIRSGGFGSTSKGDENS